MNEADKKKLLSMLGLCQRAGKLTSGSDVVVETIRKAPGRRGGASGLALLPVDTAKNTKKRVVDACFYHHVDYAVCDVTKDELRAAIGKMGDCAVVGVFDPSFARGIRAILQSADIALITATEKKNTAVKDDTVGGN